MVGIEDKSLSLYTQGLSICDISKILEGIYRFETSHEMISTAQDKAVPPIQE